MYRILLVDDDPMDVRLLREGLRECAAPVECRVAGDGQEALEVLRGTNTSAAWRPDLIVCDLHMPRMDGPTFLDALGSDASLSRIPVVILSSSAPIEDIAGAPALTARRIYRKPSTLEELASIARDLAERRCDRGSAARKAA